MTREIRFNAFDMNCVGHQSPGLWAHPRDRSWQYKDLEYWVEAAIYAQRPAGVDANRMLQIAAVNLAIGRKARLQKSPRERLHSAPSGLRGSRGRAVTFGGRWNRLWAKARL
jgi:hypothetical protein